MNCIHHLTVTIDNPIKSWKIKAAQMIWLED